VRNKYEPIETHMHIAHVIQYISKDFGGPVAGMAAMTAGLRALGRDVEVYSTHRPHEGEIFRLADGINAHVCQDTSLGILRHSAMLWNILQSADCALIHSHGLWGDPNRCAATMARRKKIPHVLGTSGMLEPNALTRSHWKKLVVQLLFQNRALREAECLIANSEKEYRDIRAYGLINPVALIPNPVFGPEMVSNHVTNESIQERFSIDDNKRTLVFLGRIHPVKGVHRLAEAWCRVSDFHNSWNLVIAGPDEGGFQSNVEEILRKAGGIDSVRFTGFLDDHWKWGLLRHADLFVMPSDYENFGIAIVEAMLAGLPVITTTRTPWQVLQDRQAGWLVDPETDSLTTVLREALAMDGTLLKEMGARGQSIGKLYAPEPIAVQLAAVYDWLLGAGERPACVKVT
jgi:glycosyltransferase involved in cell wall biosynthesis